MSMRNTVEVSVVLDADAEELLKRMERISNGTPPIIKLCDAIDHNANEVRRLYVILALSAPFFTAIGYAIARP